jgi:hypothetical protein
MKKLILILCIAFYGDLAVCPPHKTITIINSPQIKPLEALFAASAWVESSNNPNALNRLEMAYGIVQIRAIRLKDYNQRTGNRLKLKDCYDPEISKEVWYYYATQFHPLDYESISKAWNGAGKSNQIYWGKVKKRLETLK